MHTAVFTFDRDERCVIIQQPLTFTVEPLTKAAAAKGFVVNVVLIVWQVTHQCRDQPFVPSIMVIESLVHIRNQHLEFGGSACEHGVGPGKSSPKRRQHDAVGWAISNSPPGLTRKARKNRLT